MRILLLLLLSGCVPAEFNSHGLYECWNDSFQVTFDTEDISTKAYLNKIEGYDVETGEYFVLDARTDVICAKITRPTILRDNNGLFLVKVQ